MARKTPGAPSRSCTLGRMGDGEQQQAERIGHDVALASLDLLASVVAANPSTLGGFDALAVDHAGRRTGFAAFQFPRAHHQQMVDALPQKTVAPRVKIALDRGNRRKVLRQHPPLATARRDVEDRIHHRTQIGGSRPASSFRRRQQRRDQLPLATRQVAWIAHGVPFMLHTSGIIPRHLVPPSSRQRRRITKA